MRRIIFLIITAFVMSVSAPVYADMTKEEKDECLLASKNCKDAVDSIEKKIAKLNVEISKGTRVYTADEIAKLNAKLKEAEILLDTLLKN